MYALVMPCFDIPFSPIKAQAVMALTNLGILVPSSPGFVGVFHYICSQALQAVTGQNGLPALFAIGFTVPTLPFINKDFLIGGTKVVPEVTALSYATVVHLVFYITVTVWGSDSHGALRRRARRHRGTSLAGQADGPPSRAVVKTAKTNWPLSLRWPQPTRSAGRHLSRRPSGWLCARRSCPSNSSA